MPRARNKIETARHVYFSLEMYRSVRRMMSAVRQQLTIVRKYRITVSQPPIVGSPIPGLQLNSCIRGSLEHQAAAQFYPSRSKHQAWGIGRQLRPTLRAFMLAVGDGMASPRGDGSILPARLRKLAGGLPHRAARQFYGILALRCEPSSQDSVESDR